MAGTAPCTPVCPAARWPQDMLLIIVWQPNVISVIDGDIPMTYTTFESVEDVMAKDMWQIIVQSTPYLNWQLAALMEEPTQTMMISTPL